MTLKKTSQFTLGATQYTLETGRLAKQAAGSVLLTAGGTQVLACVSRRQDSEGKNDFFPLTINYQEKAYAAGKIPGGYFKREGRPSEDETLTSRLIDRSLRPIFADGYSDEVQVVVTLLSLDPEVMPDSAALIAASAAVSVAGLPFDGPVGGVRVGYIDGQFCINPSAGQCAQSSLDLMVAGTRAGIHMVESEATELSEAVLLDALMTGHQQMQTIIDAIEALAQDSPASDWTPVEKDVDLEEKVFEQAMAPFEAAYQIREKSRRSEALTQAKAQLHATFQETLGDAYDEKSLSGMLYRLEKKIVRDTIISGQRRIDGRTTEDIRQITPEVDVLLKTHGSSVFTRGETQAIVVCTLGTERDAQMVDSIMGERKDAFMLHYNFPPYCVGEVGFMSGPKRREIGHGNLAKRALKPVLPTLAEFPYVLRLVSEITESNGSSSMATVCGGTLALMDAGVPIKAPVAGIAMGLIVQDDKFAVLSDILGDEDHLGDMDFKVAGTANGITALQMDIKVKGVSQDVMACALDQAKRGRLHILEKMTAVMPASRNEVSANAPRITTIKINPQKIREVIGKGGATIKELTESTNSVIDIDDDGTIKIAAVNGDDAQKAVQMIEAITAEAEVGKAYQGKVIKIVDFGAFVEILPGKQGLVHISQMAEGRVEQVRDHLTEDQIIEVHCIEIDRQGRIRLSMLPTAVKVTES